MASGLVTRIEDLKASFERLSPRERVMVGALGGVMLLLVVGGIGFWIVSRLDELHRNNTNMRQALADLARYKDRYLLHQRRDAALKVAVPDAPLELNTYVEKAAASVGVKIDESSETTPVQGARYTQRGLEIKVRRISISQLGALIKRLEEASTHVVQVAELSVSTRWGHHEELDVQLVVATYERSKGKPATRKRRRRG